MDIHIWADSRGTFWDDAEDHGGFDRISPVGPFESRDEALIDAMTVARVGAIHDGKPAHYGDSD